MRHLAALRGGNLVVRWCSGTGLRCIDKVEALGQGSSWTGGMEPSRFVTHLCICKQHSLLARVTRYHALHMTSTSCVSSIMLTWESRSAQQCYLLSTVVKCDKSKNLFIWIQATNPVRSGDSSLMHQTSCMWGFRTSCCPSRVGAARHGGLGLREATDQSRSGPQGAQR
jgi:hypothetical protein